MYFKKYRTLLSLILSQVFLTSCSWWGGDVKDDRTLYLGQNQVLGDSSNCLENLNSFFDLYFRGLSQDKDVKESFVCIQNVVDKIFEHSEEKDVELGFSRKDLKTILNSIFPNKKNEEIDDNISILFLSKRLLVGGQKDGFTRSDHDKYNKALGEVSSQMVDSRHAIKHLFYPNDDKVNIRNESYKSLADSFSRLDEIKNKFGGELDTNEGLDLVNYIFKDGRSISKYREIAKVAKKFLFGESVSFFNSQKYFFVRIFKALEMQSRMRSVDFSKGFLVGETFYDFQQGLNLISENLRLWSIQDHNYSLKLKDVKKLVVSLHEIGVMNSLFSNPDLINKSLGRFLKSIFKTDDFDRKSFEQFYKIVRNWSRRQNRIISRFSFSWSKGLFNSIKKESVEILKEVSSFKTPQFVAKQGEPIIIKRDLEPVSDQIEYFDLSLKHTLYTVVFEFFKAYSSFDGLLDNEDDEQSLKFEDVKRIFDDARPLALEMGFADPHSCESAQRSFIEADALTINGDGDNLLSIHEAVEWMGTMISVGSIANHVFNSVSEVCTIPGMQVLGHNFMSRECFKNNFYKRTRVYTSYFYTTQAYLDMRSSPARFEEFKDEMKMTWLSLLNAQPKYEDDYAELMSKSFNSCGPKDFPLSMGEFNTSVAVTVYVENLFHQFDVNGLKGYWDSEEPLGPDFILDGVEFKAFFNKKIAAHVKNFSRESLSPWVYKVLKSSASWILSESNFKIDRAGVYTLVQNIMGKYKNTHIYRDNFCTDVYNTMNTEIAYNKEEQLTCTAADRD